MRTISEIGSIPILSMSGKIPQENWALQSVKNGKRRGGIIEASGYRFKVDSGEMGKRYVR